MLLRMATNLGVADDFGILMDEDDPRFGEKSSLIRYKLARRLFDIKTLTLGSFKSVDRRYLGTIMLRYDNFIHQIISNDVRGLGNVT